MYSDLLLDHFEHPRNVGELAAPALTVDASNPACGDILRLSVQFEGRTAVAARYKVTGCTASIAAGSVLTEWISGKTVEQLSSFNASIVERALGGLVPESKHAAVLCADAVKLLLKRSAQAARS